MKTSFSAQPSFVWICFLVLASESLSSLNQLMMMLMSVCITSEKETDYFSFLFFIHFVPLDRLENFWLPKQMLQVLFVREICFARRRSIFIQEAKGFSRKWEDVNQVEMKKSQKWRVQPKPQGIHWVSRWSTLDLRRLLSSWFYVPLFRVTLLSDILLLVSRFDLWSALDTST